MFEPQPSYEASDLNESGRDLVSEGSGRYFDTVANAVGNGINAIIYQFPDMKNRIMDPNAPAPEEAPAVTATNNVVAMRPEFQPYTQPEQPSVPVEHSYNDSSMLEGLEHTQATYDEGDRYNAPIDYSTQPVAPIDPRQFSEEQYEAAREKQVDAQLANMYGNSGTNIGNGAASNIVDIDRYRAGRQEADRIYEQMAADNQTSRQTAETARQNDLRQSYPEYFQSQGEAA